MVICALVVLAAWMGVMPGWMGTMSKAWPTWASKVVSRGHYDSKVAMDAAASG